MMKHLLLVLIVWFGSALSDTPSTFDCQCGRIEGRIDGYTSRFAALFGRNTTLAPRHIIPVDVLREFANLRIGKNIGEDLRRRANELIHELYTNLAFRNHDKGWTKNLERASHLDRVNNFIHSFYYFLPGNIFYEPPQNLRKDSCNGFEERAYRILGPNNFAAMLRLYDLINDFNAHPSSRNFANFETILTNLIDLSKMRPYEFDESQWEHDGARYSIRRPHCDTIKQSSCDSRSKSDCDLKKWSLSLIRTDEHISNRLLNAYCDGFSKFNNLINTHPEYIDRQSSNDLHTLDIDLRPGHPVLPLEPYCLQRVLCEFISKGYGNVRT